MIRNIPFDAYIGEDPFIFVSYSHADSTRVFTEIKLLREEGYRIWYDEGIAPGKEWPEEIEKALLHCSFFIVYITTTAVASINVRNEINLAIKEGKTILAIHLEETNLTGGMLLQLSSVQALMKHQLSEDAFLRKLVRSLPIETRGLYHEEVKRAASLQYSSYYPNPIKPKNWQRMNVYVFLPDAAEDVKRDYQNLSKAPTTYPSENSNRQIINDNSALPSERIELEIETPRIENSIFNPKKIIFGFYKNFHRFDIDFLLGEEWQNKKFDGSMKVNLKGFPFSEIPISFDIQSEVEAVETSRTESGTYQNIFISYSHKDSHIVEMMEKAYSALGLNFLRAVELLRPGQDWNQQIHELIRKADVFQLLWSTTASHSKFVEQEWRYALSLVQSGEKSSSFIRPVYWEKPLPIPPEELAHFHFAYIELE